MTPPDLVAKFYFLRQGNKCLIVKGRNYHFYFPKTKKLSPWSEMSKGDRESWKTFLNIYQYNIKLASPEMLKNSYEDS